MFKFVFMFLFGSMYKSFPQKEFGKPLSTWAVMGVFCAWRLHLHVFSLLHMGPVSIDFSRVDVLIFMLWDLT